MGCLNGNKNSFPKGINNEKLKYNKEFLDRLSIDLTLNSPIIKVGGASSLLFSISFLFLLIFLGIFNYLVFWIIIFSLFKFHFAYEFVIIISLILPFIDFISLGSLKKIRLISRIYYPNYKFISWITLSFLYKEMLYTLISNIPKRHIILFSLFFFLLSGLLTYRNIASFNHRSTALHDWFFFIIIFLTQ